MRSHTDVEPQAQLAGMLDAFASAFALWMRAPRPGCSLLGLKYAAAPSDSNAGLGSALTKAGGRVAFGALRMPFSVVQLTICMQVPLSSATCLRRGRQRFPFTWCVL